MENNNVIQFPAKRQATVPVARNNNTARVVTFKQDSAASHENLKEFDVWQAIAEDRIEVHYQPQVDLKSGEVVSAEALVRIRDRDGSLVYPDQFIEMVEGTALIGPMGRLVIEHACRDLAHWRSLGMTLRHVSVNLSAHQLEVDAELVDFVDEVLTANGLAYADIEFELTERQHLQSAQGGNEVLHELAARGSRLVIDDFGVGFGSNLYLTELPVSGLKLDISMTRQLGNNEAATKVVQSLVTLADDLGLEVVAEGIETAQQQDILAGMGCTHGQGYHYAAPVDMVAFSAVTAERHIGQPTA